MIKSVQNSLFFFVIDEALQINYSLNYLNGIDFNKTAQTTLRYINWALKVKLAYTYDETIKMLNKILTY